MIWWCRRSLTLLGSFLLILQFLQGIVLAGPVKRSIRVVREVYPEIEPEKLDTNQAEVCIVGDVIYGADEPVPADQPCLKCKCQPPGVQCETTRCVKKPGCKAIHKSNKCCPEYQCECEHEGKLYANGERLETLPGGECKVCYCRGGEVQCANVSCYIRTDCEGTTVPGKCCPKYDHCPPREPMVDRLVPYTTLQALTTSSNLDSLGYTTANVSSESGHFTTSIYDVEEVTNNKIGEAKTESALTYEVIIGTQLPNDTVEINNLPSDGPAVQSPEAPKETEQKSEDSPKITIQEIIPEIKEFPITGPPKRETNLYHVHQAIETSKNKDFELNDLDLFRDRENNVNELTDTESDSSEISEVYHHPPPVLKIGDQLLFLKKGELVPGSDISTPLPVITIIGAEGLQRGTEESFETHEEAPPQVQNPNKNNSESSAEVTESDEPVSNTTTTVPTHIFSLVKKTNEIAEVTTKVTTPEDDSSFETTKFEKITDATENSTLASASTVTDTDVYLDENNSTVGDLQVTTELGENVTDVVVISKNITGQQPEDSLLERSPEYPLLPDVMSPLNIDETLERLEEAKGNGTLHEESKRIKNSITDVTPMTFTYVTSDPVNVTTEVAIQSSIGSIKSTTSEDSSEDSREHTTPKGMAVSTMEDASVEVSNTQHEINKKDLLDTVSEILTDTVEVHENQTDLKLKKDVEIFDPVIVMKNFHSTLKTTTEFAKINKEDESEEVFKVLNEEVATARSYKKKPTNKEEEADEIFKELLEEVTSTVSSNDGADKESQLLKKVSDAIYRFEKKDSKESLDTNILGILKEFFSNQNKFNKDI